LFIGEKFTRIAFYKSSHSIISELTFNENEICSPKTIIIVKSLRKLNELKNQTTNIDCLKISNLKSLKQNIVACID
jgi:hypothetical protein